MMDNKNKKSALQLNEEQELPGQTTEVIDNLPEEERRALINEIVRIEQRSYSGPLPPPQVLAEYEKTLKGSADRILQMAEREQGARHSIDREIIANAAKQHKRGQYMGCALVIVLAAMAFTLGFLGHDWLSGMVFTGAIVSVAGIFVLNREPKKQKEEGGSKNEI